MLIRPGTGVATTCAPEARSAAQARATSAAVSSSGPPNSTTSPAGSAPTSPVMCSATSPTSTGCSRQPLGTGRTGHAESVEVTFDPAEVSYGKLLQVFFSVAHNPTQLNYQGPDRGTQYRSAIFPLSAEQEKVAAAYMVQLDEAKLFGGKIVTTLEGAKPFYPAEEYHQDFLTLNPTYPYIVYNDLPKIENLKRLFPGLYREKPVLVMQAKS